MKNPELLGVAAMKVVASNPVVATTVATAATTAAEVALATTVTLGPIALAGYGGYKLIKWIIDKS